MAQIGTGTEQSSSSTAMINYLGDGGPDGQCMGRSATDKDSFFGATPVVQQVIGAPTSLTTSGQSTTLFTGSTQTIAFMNQMAAVVTALRNLGLCS
jgi:hypothetical protein